MPIENLIVPILTQFGFVLLYYFLIFRPSQRRDYDTLQTKYNELEASYAKLQGDYETLKVENREIKAENRTLRVENQRLQGQVDRLNAALIAALVSIPAVAMLVVMIVQHR